MNTIIKTTNTVIEMRNILLGIAVLVGTAVSAQTPTENYVKTTAYQTEVQEGESVPEKDKIETINYVDGLGRAKQSIIVRGGGQQQDIITPYAYDTYGRMAKEYLPYASSQTQNGAIYIDPLSEVHTFYNTDKYEDTTNPYSEAIFEPSPLNRVLEQGAPGEAWKANDQTDTDHTIKSDWTTNTATEVVYFDVTFSNNTEAPVLVQDGNYEAGELYVTITKDENWQASQTHPNDHTTKEYTDKLGRVVLKRTYNENVAHDTHYVYDDYGNLSYVIPPKVVVDDGISSTELAELCYQYNYDYRNRLVEKKIPGKGWESIVYNKLDQPILTQDANQKTNGEWLFTKYDAFGRVTYTGMDKNNNADRLTLQTAATAVSDQFVSKTSTVNTYAGTAVYYTNTTYPINFDELLTINYYDNYNFDHSVSNPGTVLGQTVITTVNGLPTGSKVGVLDTDDWITTVTYYDQKRRPIYVHSTNTYLNTVDIVESKLDFDCNQGHL